MRGAIRLLETLDRVIGGLLEETARSNLLVLITSDHGNLEDLSHRGHTRNPVPTLLIGPRERRVRFASGIKDLTDIAPAVLREFDIPPPNGGMGR
jgi:bisphosphoglycerate-independent phosphoglycerate mutase (AlkP superfamily)